MTSTNPPSFDVVDRALRQLGATEGVTEAHGSLCGFTCILGPRARAVWVAGLVDTGIETASADAADAEILSELAIATTAALSDAAMAFYPLLPPDDRPLSSRADGLAEWCSGFMHGLGEAAASDPGHDILGGEVVREIMEDFAEIARVTLGEEETDLEAEAAYTELVEFVRVSVQLIFEELRDVRHGVAAARVH
jgi:uncharacterized protein YgfB (UPF0149 family)